ncbi:DeoR/GlpR family DNA-binding transcription regulator [Nesterenkonia flava]|uniref:Lactose phosphotransferase system repressor n=1 Tax=Nesterenkonia flava TaxID=469799 RepID=A0ABU1FVP7_9MICC|nr:DeoR/GlpR family DNA-binding transcription regulator [Nesterenkonia flava]MDR5712741.1 DeoR/GlpR family DNA-binding transcription regulator [Nesterenkonia flava]
MSTSERHRRILALVDAAEFVSVAELVAEVGASEATLRRDLSDLDAQGLLRRVHGGARPAQLRGFGQPFAARTSVNQEGKRRIAASAAALLSPGEAVVLDSGTTALETARSLTQMQLRVVPLCLPGLSALTAGDTVSITTPGGDLRVDEQAFTGPLTQRTLSSLRFDTALITPCAVSLHSGATAFDLDDAAVKQAAMDSSARRILLCDATKWGRTAFAAVAPLERFDALVTDRELSGEERAQLADAGVEVHIV